MSWRARTIDHFTVVCSVTWPLNDKTLFWYRPHCFCQGMLATISIIVTTYSQHLNLAFHKYKLSDKNVLDVDLSDLCLCHLHILVRMLTSSMMTVTSNLHTFLKEEIWISLISDNPLQNKNAIYSSSVKLTKDQFPLGQKKNSIYNKIKNWYPSTNCSTCSNYSCSLSNRTDITRFGF